MKWLVVVAIMAAAAFAIASYALRRSGYATPLGLPPQISWRGRDYLDPRCLRKPYRRDLPLKRVGAVPGFLTGAKPIYLPHSMPRGLDPVYLYVRAGCLNAYDLSGGP